MRYANGERSFTEMGKAYGVSRESLKEAVLGETFKHLPMPPNGFR